MLHVDVHRVGRFKPFDQSQDVRRLAPSVCGGLRIAVQIRAPRDAQPVALGHVASPLYIVLICLIIAKPAAQDSKINIAFELVPVYAALGKADIDTLKHCNPPP